VGHREAGNPNTLRATASNRPCDCVEQRAPRGQRQQACISELTGHREEASAGHSFGIVAVCDLTRRQEVLAVDLNREVRAATDTENRVAPLGRYDGSSSRLCLA
jgi:hypothetical protein